MVPLFATYLGLPDYNFGLVELLQTNVCPRPHCEQRLASTSQNITLMKLWSSVSRLILVCSQTQLLAYHISNFMNMQNQDIEGYFVHLCNILLEFLQKFILVLLQDFLFVFFFFGFPNSNRLHSWKFLQYPAVTSVIFSKNPIWGSSGYLLPKDSSRIFFRGFPDFSSKIPPGVLSGFLIAFESSADELSEIHLKVQF